MLIELGNHSSRQAGDNQPRLTTIHIPEADDGSTHPDAVYTNGRHPHQPDTDGPIGTLTTPGPQLGGYTHEIGGITVPDFKSHLADAILYRNGITRLPDHEFLVAVLHPTDGLWQQHAIDKPQWVDVRPTELTPPGRVADVQAFLSEYWDCPPADQFFNAVGDLEALTVKKELAYWTRWGAPGQLPPDPGLPPLTALYLDDARVNDNNHDGGGQVGSTGAATASSATSLTNSGAAWTTNQWAGYRVYAQSSTSNMVWANVVSNTATVLTVDRWYAVATPGGSAGSTPSSTSPYLIADGGMASWWFVGLCTGTNAAAHGDHSLSTNGNAEITTASGGLIRKIAPYAQTSGVATRAFTLTPVFTANGSDSLPVTVTGCGEFCSMVTTFSQAGGPMKFEDQFGTSATLSASGDQLTVTVTGNGS